MNAEEYQQRMAEMRIGRGKLGPEGRFPQDYGPNPAVSHEHHVFYRGAGGPGAPAAAPVAAPVVVEDLSHLNPRKKTDTNSTD